MAFRKKRIVFAAAAVLLLLLVFIPLPSLTLKGKGAALGIDDDGAYTAATWKHFDAGQILLIGTDGIWEARNRRNAMFGKAALRDLIRQYARNDARDIRDAILKALDRFQEGSRPEDDITLIVVKRDAVAV